MLENKKILHIIDHLRLGGAQSVVKGIFEAQQNNNNIFLFSLRKREQNLQINHKNVYTSLSTNPYSISPLKEIKDIIASKNINILHCHLARSQLYGYLIKKFISHDVILIFHEHGEIFPDNTAKSITKLKNHLYSHFLKLCQKNVNIFLSVSNATREKMIKYAKIKENNIKVIYNFVDIAKFNKKNIKHDVIESKKKLGIEKNDFVIGYAARLVEMKGWKEFIESANILVKKYSFFKFIIAGDGQDRDDLLALIKKYNLTKNVIFLGYISDMVWLYSIVDLFVIPSYFEAMGITVIEAQAMGIPVLCSDVKSLNEIVRNYENALLFDARNHYDLSNKIKTVYCSHELRNILVNNGLRNAQRFDLDNYLKLLNENYLTIDA